MSEHVNYLRLAAAIANDFAEGSGSGAASKLEASAMCLTAAADHLEAVQGALRASTELLFRYTTGTNDLGTHRSSVEQIAANEAVLGGGK